MSSIEGASLFILRVGRMGVYFFKVGVESGLSTVHFPLGQSNFHASFF
jgi:hypothetical protein